jgi:Ca2+-dependent lipid-binding protein
MTILNAELIRDTEVMGTMNPFVSVEFLQTKYDTSQREGKKPVWNEQLPVFRNMIIEDDIVLRMFDKDMFENDDIGELKIKVRELR